MPNVAGSARPVAAGVCTPAPNGAPAKLETCDVTTGMPRAPNGTRAFGETAPGSAYFTQRGRPKGKTR